MNESKKCNICPRMCNINRDNSVGLCGVGNDILVARIAPHYFEEPVISGTNGSGTIFFSGCNLKCIYCQNIKISKENFGKKIDVETLANKMIELQEKGVHNINLVTPTHYIIKIRDAIVNAKEKGLTIPIVYNTSGYERVESLKLLEGLIDIYLPDFKYYSDVLAMKYSKAPQYFDIAKSALKEMYRQVGNPIIENGIMKKGIIVRHLMLPENLEDSKKIINYLYKTYKDNIYISIMNQYTPLKQVKNIKELNHKVKEEDYDDLVNYAYDLGIRNCFIQVGETMSESFIPDFDLTGI